MAANVVVKKKMHKKLNRELLNSLRENDKAEKTEIKKAKITNMREAIELINCYEEIKTIES